MDMAKNATSGTPASNGNGGAQNEAGAATKQPKSSATYIGTVDGKEKEFNFPTPAATIVRSTFANGTVREVSVTDLSVEITNCAVLQGIATRLQRSYQGEKDIDKCIEAVDETIADLKNNVWIAPGGGPRTTVLAAAIKRTLEAKGEEVSVDRYRGIVEKLKVESFVEAAMKNKSVLAAVEDIKFENLQKRRAEAKKAAKDEPGDVMALGV
jgi:hypothetical protein